MWVEYDFEKYLSQLVRYFLPKKLREHIQESKKSVGFLWIASVHFDLIDMKTVPALQAIIVSTKL